MKKIILFGGILGGAILVFLVLIIGTLIWGGGILRERLPTWLDGGQRMVSVAIMKAEELFPGVKEQVRQVAPGLIETVEKIIPGGEIPAKDVSGEEIKPIPRFPNMIRVSYAVENQKKMVVYKGRVNFAVVREFYQKEMLAMGFREKVVRAYPEEEIHQFNKGGQDLEFRFRKIPTVLSEFTELTIKEL